MSDIRRVIDVTFHGHIHGMKAAMAQMRRHGGGTVVNVASALARRAVALQSAYCAVKHGIFGFPESLRLEFARDAPGAHLADVLSPRLIDPFMLGPAKAFDKQRSDKPDNGTASTGLCPGPGARRASFGQRSKFTSLLTERLQLHPTRSKALIGAALTGVIAALPAPLAAAPDRPDPHPQRRMSWHTSNER